MPDTADLGVLVDSIRSGALDRDGVVDLVGQLPPGAIEALLGDPALDPSRQATAARVPQPHQEWSGSRGHVWMSGRDGGKTWAAAHWLDTWCTERPNLRCRIIAPTFGDGVAAHVDGESGVMALNPEVKFKASQAGGSRLEWPNGSTAWFVGTPNLRAVDRLRALTNIDIDVWEEAAANPMLKQAFDQASLSLRRKGARWIAATTPRPVATIKAWDADPNVTVMTGSSHLNKFADPEWLQQLEELYAGTRLYNQEVLGEIIDAVEGALFKAGPIDRNRINVWDRNDPLASLEGWVDANPDLDVPLPAAHVPWRVIVAVDPPGETAECGIVVGAAPAGAKSGSGHMVVLDDLSVTGAPEVWGEKVVEAVNTYDAEAVYVEKNQGGDMTRSTIHAVDSSLVVHKINADESKSARAEPVATLYARGWIHHVGFLPKLEEQQTTWVPDVSKSPDRLDALVHAARVLLPSDPAQRGARGGFGLKSRNI